MKTDNLPFFLRDILVACCLLTRLPMPRLSASAFEQGARATWAYPFAGVVVGGCATIVVTLAQGAQLPMSIIAGLAVATMVVVTGAMHEDGLSDTADGFWGGADTERRLAIMKDSQIGTYGTLSLIFCTGLRWLCYVELLATGVGVLVAIAALSRCAMPPLMRALPHARDTGLSHSVGKPEAAAVVLSCGLGLGITIVLLGEIAIAPVIAVVFAAVLVASVAKHRIGGQTGDVLGATQQLCELSALVTLVAMLP